MHCFTTSTGVKPPLDRKVDLIEIQRVATQIELIVMKNYINSSAKEVHVTYNARK